MAPPRIVLGYDHLSLLLNTFVVHLGSHSYKLNIFILKTIQFIVPCAEAATKSVHMIRHPIFPPFVFLQNHQIYIL